MRSVRGSLGAVAVGGRIYAIGGGEPGISLETTEVYDPTINAWMPGGATRFQAPLSAYVYDPEINACMAGEGSVLTLSRSRHTTHQEDAHVLGVIPAFEMVL